MIEVAGDSMRPRYKSGDIVACQIIKNQSFLQWNRVHVIATREQGIILKRIGVSDKKKHLSVIADNPEFPSFDIPMAEITGMALVVGGVVQE
jgi:phage repressor protein C with HTH and peptisase S24 domain